jgi:hypothetical protein
VTVAVIRRVSIGACQTLLTFIFYIIFNVTFRLALLLIARSVAMRPLPQTKQSMVAIVPRPKLGCRVRTAASFAISATSLAAVSLFAKAPPAAAAVKVATRAASKIPWILSNEPLTAIAVVILTTCTTVFSALSWILSIKFKSLEDKSLSLEDKIDSLKDFVKAQAQETKDSLRLAAQATMNPPRAHLMYADQRSIDEIISDPANAPLASKSSPPNTTI